MDESSAARCAQCGAALAADAPWCSLCFTPVPVAAPVVAPPPVPAAVEPPVRVEPAAAAPVHLAAGHPLYPHITPERLGRPAMADPGPQAFRVRPVGVGVPQPRLVTTDEPAPPAVPEQLGQSAQQSGQPEQPEQPPPAWPCVRCGASVPMALDRCPQCGAGFLEAQGAGVPSIVLPVVGDIGRRSQGQRYTIAAGLGLGAAVLLVALIALLGAIF